MKVTKRLVKAICALVASLILSIGVCLAWFAQNGKVDATGMQSKTDGINIESFTVTAYELSGRTPVEQGVEFTVGNEKNSVGGIKMSDYGGLELSETATALLLKFDYKLKTTANKQYAIYAQCESTRGDLAIGNTVDGIMHLDCALSSVVSFYKIGEDETSASVTVTQKDEMEEKEVPETIGSLVTLKNEISDDVIEGTFYCIIDYVESEIYSQYYKALSIEGTSLSTPMDFFSDITFYMVEISATSATL